MTWYLVWSNQHAMWWRPGSRGYTRYIEEAGRYPRAEAERIVGNATCDGQLKHQRTDPVSGVEYVSFDEVMVSAPEVVGPPDEPERLREQASELLTAANRAEGHQAEVPS